MHSGVEARLRTEWSNQGKSSRSESAVFPSPYDMWFLFVHLTWPIQPSSSVSSPDDFVAQSAGTVEYTDCISAEG